MLYVIRYTTSAAPGVTKTAVQELGNFIGSADTVQQTVAAEFIASWPVNQLPGVQVVGVIACDPRRLRHGPIFSD